jgi:hypothetical protein
METSHERAVPDLRIESPTRPGYVIEVFSDARAVWAEKEYLKYEGMTMEERIGEAEELRREVYGQAYSARGLQGPVEVFQRKLR